MAQGNSRISREFQHFFLGGGQEISGIQNISLQFAEPIVPIRYIGGTSSPQLYPIGIRKGSINISYIPLHNDFLLPFLTGQAGINGYILKDKSNTNENYSFTSGFLNNYSIKCSVGEIPTVDVNFDVLGSLGRISGDNQQVVSDWANITVSTGVGPSKIATYSSIDLTLDQFDTNRVQSFSLDISVSRNPIYSIGSPNLIGIDINFPIEINFTAVIDIDNYSLNKLGNFPCLPKINNLIISLKDHQTYEEFLRYNFNNLIFNGESYTTTVDGNVNLNLQYKVYLFREDVGG